MECALFATTSTQGMRTSDFCWAEEGELVTLSSPYDCDKHDIDGPCGCRRSMIGLSSKKATTTFTVDRFSGDEITLRDALVRYWQGSKWSRFFDQDALHQIVEEDLHALMRIASHYPIGTILEIRGEVIQKREPAEREQ